jgi:hypothetical protein
MTFRGFQMKNLAYLYLLTLTLVGCTPTQKLNFDEPVKSPISNSRSDGQSDIYIVRGGAMNASPFSLSVYLDGKYVGLLERNKYLAANAGSGKHIIKFDCVFPCAFKFEFGMQIDGGKKYYFETFFEPTAHDYTSGLRQIDQKQALDYLAYYGLENPGM